MSKAAQGFALRCTAEYAADGNPRRTPLIGEKAISGWKLSKFSCCDKIHHRFLFTINTYQFVEIIIKKGSYGT